MTSVPYDVFALAFIMLWSFVSWLLFIRLSMIPMEKALKQKGVEPSAWDGVGIRAAWYAWAIVFQGTKLQQENDILFASGDITNYIRRKDRILAGMLIISSSMFLSGGVLYYLFRM